MTYAARQQRQLDRRGESRQLDKPRAGWWVVRLVKDGPLVPAAIVLIPYIEETDAPEAAMERHPHFEAFIAGDPVPVESVWHRKGEPITEAEYRFRLADQAWVQTYQPDAPAARPRDAIDPLTVETPF